MRNEILSSLMSELNLSKDKFNKHVQSGLSNPLHFSAFNQIKLMEDYLLFKKMMMKRNHQLNDEINKQLKEKYDNYPSKKEDFDLEKAIKESLEFQKQNSFKEEQEKQDLENVLKLSKAEYEEYMNNLKIKEIEDQKISKYADLEEEKENVNSSKLQEKNLFKIKSRTHETG